MTTTTVSPAVFAAPNCRGVFGGTRAGRGSVARCLAGTVVCVLGITPVAALAQSAETPSAATATRPATTTPSATTIAPPAVSPAEPANLPMGSAVPKIAVPTVPEELREPAQRVAEIFADVVAGNTEDAYERWQKMLPVRAPAPKTPADPDPYLPFQRLFSHFARDFESLDFVAHRRISSAAVKLLFVANTRRGPFLLDILAFRIQGQWHFLHLNIQELARLEPPNWLPLDSVLPVTPQPIPIPIPLPNLPAGTAAIQP